MKRLSILLFLFLCLVTQGYGQIHQALIADSNSPEKRECDANMRVILGALEMYNMDHAEMMMQLHDEDVRKDGKFLVEQYLKSPILGPTPQCIYACQGDMTKDGIIICKNHGKIRDGDSKTLFEEFKAKADKMLAAGANINEKSATGQTAVHVAIEKENALILEFLIAKGANLNLSNADNKTPLRLALDNHCLGMARILIKNKALYDIDPTKLPPKEPLPQFEIGGDASGLLMKSGDKWVSVKSSLTIEKITRLKISKTGVVSLRPYSPSSAGKPDYWGFYIFLHPETEVEIATPNTEEMAIPLPLGINLLNGELTVNRDLSERTVVFQAGTIFMESLSGTQKLFYQGREDTGEVVVKVGYAEIVSHKPSFQGQKISGFYKVSLTKGKIGEPQQADIVKYQWPKVPTPSLSEE